MIVLVRECKDAVTTVGLNEYGCMHGQVVSWQTYIDLTLQGIYSDAVWIIHSSEKAVSLHPSTAAHRVPTGHVYEQNANLRWSFIFNNVLCSHWRNWFLFVNLGSIRLCWFSGLEPFDEPKIRFVNKDTNLAILIISCTDLSLKPL